MKKILALLLALTMVLSLAACGNTTPSETEGTTTAPVETTAEPTTEAGLYTPGTYTAQAQGFQSKVTVTITVDATTITDVQVDVSGESTGIGAAIGNKVITQILDAQSAEIDGVASATYSSKGVISALTECLNQAMGQGGASEATVADGTYSGTAVSFGFLSMMTCDVTFEKGAIKDIVVTKESDSATGEWFGSAQALLIPRIIENQSLAVDSISGATSSSNAIKACVAEAINAAGGDSNDWYKDVAKKTETVKLEGYDVIVVGMGGSGVLSYCAAADNGASVFGIETAGKIGGNSVCTYGPMALNSEHMKNLYNEGKDYFDEKELYDIWIDYVESEDKADIIYKAVYNSGSALDYYIDNFQFDFQGMGGMLGSFAVPSWTHLWTVYTPDTTGWNVLGPNKTYQFIRALDIAKAMNDKNDYMTELTATELIFDADGNVTGVKAEYYDGTQYEIYGKSVILATGGFLGNEEMMVEYLGDTVNSIGVTTCDGTGIQMGISAGGATYMTGTLPMVHISQVDNMIKNDDLTADQKAILSALALTTDQLMVTTEGKQWGNVNQSGTVDEGVTVEIVFAPNYKYYVIYSQEEIDAIKTTGLSEAQARATSMFMGQGGQLPAAGTPVADIEEILSVGMEYNNVFKGESIAELAKALGCDEANLTATLGKEGTYYAVTCASWAYATVGGLDVDVNMNVLREDGTPIPNLFAVGQDSEGVCNIDGKAYTPWGGQAQSWTFVSGQIAGTEAAKVALGQ